MSTYDALDVFAYERDVTEHALFGAARARVLSDLTYGKPWQVALDQGRATFGRTDYRVQILGTHAAEDKSFLWAWANPDAQDWEASLGAVRTLRALGENPGYTVFRKRKVAGNWVPFKELAWVAGELAGGHGVHFAEVDGGATVALLLTDAPVEMARFPLAYLAGVLLEFQAQTRALSRPCVARFLERIDFTVQSAPTAVEGERVDGSRVVVKFDEQGRIGNVEL